MATMIVEVLIDGMTPAQLLSHFDSLVFNVRLGSTFQVQGEPTIRERAEHGPEVVARFLENLVAGTYGIETSAVNLRVAPPQGATYTVTFSGLPGEGQELNAPTSPMVSKAVPTEARDFAIGADAIETAQNFTDACIARYQSPTEGVIDGWLKDVYSFEHDGAGVVTVTALGDGLITPGSVSGIIAFSNFWRPGLDLFPMDNVEVLLTENNAGPGLVSEMRIG